jgi:hypothetical protein
MSPVRGGIQGIPVRAAIFFAFLSCSASDIAETADIELELEATYPDGFGFLQTVRELSDGRVMAADPLGQVLVVWDVDRGLTDTLGRVGNGPQEYRQPDAVFPLPADSTLLVDLGNTRLTAIGPDGTFGSSLPIMRPRHEGFPMNLMPRFTDGLGRIYFYLSANLRGSMADSAFIARFDRANETVDTLGVLRVPIPEFERVGNNMVMTSGPLMPRDGWAVGLDGSVAIARAADYSIEWIAADGSLVHGSPKIYQPVQVGRAEQERWADEAQANMMQLTSVMSREGGVSNVEMRRGGGSRSDVTAIRWPDEMPPIHAERSKVSYDGNLWVERHVRVGSDPVVDVFDTQGNKIAEVALPTRSRVVGFGVGAVYLVTADDLDLLWLRKYRLS